MSNLPENNQVIEKFQRTPTEEQIDRNGVEKQKKREGVCVVTYPSWRSNFGTNFNS